METIHYPDEVRLRNVEAAEAALIELGVPQPLNVLLRANVGRPANVDFHDGTKVRVTRPAGGSYRIQVHPSPDPCIHVSLFARGQEAYAGLTNPAEHCGWCGRDVPITQL